MKKNYLDLLDKVRSIAQLGLNYTKNHYDIENYNNLLKLTAQEYSEFTGLPTAEITERFKNELGYITPKIGVNGAIFNDVGQILLELRSDDKLWGVPGGWVDVLEGPEAAIVREFMEEAQIVVEPVEIIKFITRLPGDFNQPHTTVHILYYCKYISGAIVKSHESLELSFKNMDEIINWHRDHKAMAEAAQNFYKAHFEDQNNH